MSLLIFTPTVDDLLRPETVASIKAQVTDVAFEWEVSDHNPYPGRDMRNVVAQYQRAWKMALEGGYEGLLTVEHDMVLPSNAVQTLYNTDAPVVYGVYMLRHGTKTLNAWQYTGGRNIGMSLSLYPKELEAARKAGAWEVSGTGWGCTLIRREVLQRLTVRQSGDHDAGDIAFSTDCLRAKIKQIARFDVECGHIEPSGNVLWPFANGGGIVNRVLALQTMNVLVDGEVLNIKQGRYYSITPDAAQDLARAGYVRITNDDDSQQQAGEKAQPDLGPSQLAVDPKARGRSKRNAIS